MFQSIKYSKLGIFFAVVILIVMFFTLFNQNRDQNFWKCFSKNETAIFGIVSAKEPIADDLTSQLRKVDQNLVWSIGGSSKDSKRDFVISAGGIKSSFPAVTSLYNSVPKDLTHWNFVAFSPKTDTNEIQFADKSRKVSDFYFKAEKSGDKYDLDVSVKNYEKGNDDQIAYLFLDSLLGEYNVEMKLAVIDIHNLDDKEIGTLLPLKQIGDFIK